MQEPDDHSTHLDGLTDQIPDVDPDETKEWLEALDSVIAVDGRPRARYLMARLVERARDSSVGLPASMSTPYVNTIPPVAEAPYPGDEYLEQRIRRFIRWNAAVMVIRANRAAENIGGHLSTFASSATRDGLRSVGPQNPRGGRRGPCTPILARPRAIRSGCGP